MSEQHTRPRRAGAPGRRRVRTAAAAALLATASTLVATTGTGRASSDGADRVKAATARYHDLDAATADGFGLLRDAAGTACIAEAGRGGMGLHYVHGDRVQDPSVVATMPEALVYAPGKDGAAQRLVALEWVVLAEAWHAAGNSARPRLFDQEFVLVPAGNRYGLPPFYALHAWLWDRNPAGLFAEYDPDVVC